MAAKEMWMFSVSHPACTALWLDNHEQMTYYIKG